MFQNSFIWKKKIGKKWHTIIFYNNPIGSLYPICTQMDCPNGKKIKKLKIVT
jgi:hypothetical protein